MKVSPENDLARFRHLREAIEKTLTLSAGLSRTQLAEQELYALALTRLLEIAGKAASKITPERQQRYTDVPWPMLTGMRNHLAHGYFSVDLDIVWDTIRHNLPPLQLRLDEIIEELERDQA